MSQDLKQLTVNQLRHAYTEAHHHVETNRDIALRIERELNERGITIDARQSYATDLDLSRRIIVDSAS